MDSKQSKKRLTTIIIGTLVFCLAMFSILFYLDKTPGNKYYEHPNIFSQEYLKKYSATQTEKISLLWSYENFHNIDSPIISPDGKIILFMTTINEKPSLVCLNNEGHKMWVYSDFKRLDAQPHIKLRNNIIVVYCSYPPGDVGDLAQDHWLFYVFDIHGRLLWDKTVWGVPFFTDSGNTILVSTYNKTLIMGDKEPDSNENCIDPIVRNLAGGDAGGYDVRGASLHCPTLSGICTELGVPGIEDISIDENYILTSCIGKTALFDKTLKLLALSKYSGYARLSPDGNYFVIRKHNEKSDDDELIVHNTQGHLLWRKSISKYFPNWQGMRRHDEGVVPLRDGYLTGISAKFKEHTGEMSNMDVTINIFDDAGNIISRISKVEDFLLDIVAAPSHSKDLYVVGIAEKDREVQWWLNNKLSQILQWLGIWGVKTERHVYRLYHVAYSGKVLARSAEVIPVGDMSVLVPADNSEYIIAATTSTLYFFKKIS